MAENERKDRFVTDTGFEVKPVYTPLDLEEAGFDYTRDLGLPGAFPFTRGARPNMYRGQPWVTRAYAGFGDPEACNQRYKEILKWGADQIAIAADLPTQCGYDSDHVMARGEVGKTGVAIDSLRDMEVVFDGIPLNSMRRVSLLGNSFGPVALALFIALGEKQGLKPADFVVELQNDILKEYTARGTHIFPIRPSVRVATDAVAWCSQDARHWLPCALCANHLNAAGAGSVRAAAFALANGMCYLNHLLGKGHKIDDVAPMFQMFPDERADFFVMVCLLRAMRRLWARLMKEKLHAQNDASLALKTTAYSHGGETLLEPANNIVRITLASLAYVLGGVDSVCNAAYDEVLGTPNEDSAKIAMRTQQILAHELGIADTVDPLAGSYFIESLTTKIEQQVYEEFLKVEGMGGAIAAIDNGYYRSVMADGAIRRQREFESGARVSIGVNKFRTESNVPYGAFRVDPACETRQVARLQQVKKERSQRAVREALAHVRSVAHSDANLVPPVLEAVRAYATIGEICDVFRDVFGEYRATEHFGAGAEKGTAPGKRIKVLIGKVGLDGHEVGARVVARALADAGMEVVYSGLRQTPEMLVKTALQEEVDVVGVSILSGSHNAFFPEIIRLMNQHGIGDVPFIAGGIIPAEDITTLKEMGLKAIYPPESRTSEIVDFVRGLA